MRNACLLVLLLILTVPAPVAAAADSALPRFESLRFSESRLRRGPGRHHRIDMLYQRRGLPLEVIDEYRDWRRVRDRDGLTGWLHRSQLSPRRSAVVVEDDILLRKRPREDAKIRARLEKGVVLRLETCDPDWCAVSVDDLHGWSPRAGLWGLKDGEIIDDP